jgi:hypothetical protein
LRLRRTLLRQHHVQERVLHNDVGAASQELRWLQLELLGLEEELLLLPG